MHLWQKILIGMVAGLATGLFVGEEITVIKPIGDIFIRLIKMLVVPLVFFSLVSGVTAMKDPAAMGRIGIKAMSGYILTTCFAITIGLIVASIIQPGAGVEIPMDGTHTIEKPPALSEMFINIVPTNPIEALAEGNILQIIFFAVVLGVSLSMIKDKAKAYLAFNSAMEEAMYAMTNIVMAFAPFGVFALMAWVAGTQGTDILISLGKVVLAFMLGITIHVVVVYGLAIRVIGGLSPLKFFRHMLNTQMVAFSTSSSLATLPVTMKTAEEKIGVSNATSSFVLPLGTTINMDGSALYQGICTMFIAQAVGVDLTFGELLTVVLTATVASIGTVGIPGTALIMLTMVLTSVGLPIEGIALILGVDRFLDMFRTVVNVTGDAMIATLVDKSEGTFDEGTFHL